METGEYLIGINPEKDKTGKGSAVKIIKIKSIVENVFEEDEEVKLFYAISSKGQNIYLVDEKDFEKPNPGNDKAERLKADIEGRGKHQSYLGYDFGEVIPTNVNGYKTMLEDFIDVNDEEEIKKGNLIFLGTEPDSDEPDSEHLVRLCWARKEDKSGSGSAMDQTLIDKTSFVKNMLIPMEGENKRMTIHYINNEGEKTKQAVNEAHEITDMKEELYRMNN
jgi:hypothetical protein